VRPVGMLEPGENKTLVVSFCPNESKWVSKRYNSNGGKEERRRDVTGCAICTYY